MANKSKLHISKLKDFKEWLIKEGWDIEESKEIREILSAKKTGRKNPLIVYTKINAKEHLNVIDKDNGVVNAFLRDCEKPKTNADKIRAMSDEELEILLNKAVFCGGLVRSESSSTECVGCSYPFCYPQRFIEWLKKEAKEN